MGEINCLVWAPFPVKVAPLVFTILRKFSGIAVSLLGATTIKKVTMVH